MPRWNIRKVLVGNEEFVRRVELWRLYYVRRVLLNWASLWGVEMVPAYIYQLGESQIFVF